MRRIQRTRHLRSRGSPLQSKGTMMETENKPATEVKQKKPTFKVYTRFSDKVTFIALVIGVVITFTACLLIYSWGFYNSQAYWGVAQQCIEAQDFKCVVDSTYDYVASFAYMLNLIGSCLSLTGLIAGALLVSLFRPTSLRCEG